MAVSRAAVLSPIQPQSFPVIPRALVLGGGVAGLNAALTLADQGFHTYLVERESSLGGLARELFFTLEGPDPQEFLHQLQAAVYHHPNIEVHIQTELIKLTGHVGQFKSTVRRVTLDGFKERELVARRHRRGHRRPGVSAPGPLSLRGGPPGAHPAGVGGEDQFWRPGFAQGAAPW